MNIIENADMSRYCTYKAGGSARYLISVENIEELREVLLSVSLYLKNQSNRPFWMM